VENWAAIRRKSRRAEAKKAAEATRANAAQPPSRPQATPRPRASVIASPSPNLDLRFENITIMGPGIPGFDGVVAAEGGSNGLTISGFDTGLVIPEGGNHEAKRLRVDRNQTGVDNAGTFDGPDTIVE
jgi:hypothetical protein